MLHYCKGSYEDLVKNSGQHSMNLRKTTAIFIDIYRTIDKLNPEFMTDLFKVCKTNGVQTQ